MSETGVPNIDQILKAGFDYGNTGAPVRRKTNRRKASVPYLLAAPAVMWLLVFFLLPTIYMFTVSLYTGTLGPTMHLPGPRGLPLTSATLTRPPNSRTASWNGFRTAR